MSIYLITYDLRTPGKDYNDLWDALKRLGAKRALESVWLVKREWGGSSGNPIDPLLSGHLDSNDRMIVTLFDEWSMRNTLVKVSDL